MSTLRLSAQTPAIGLKELVAGWRDVPRLRSEQPQSTRYMRLAVASWSGRQEGGPWVGIDELSPHAFVAILAAEDPWFFQHRGISWRAALAGAVSAIASGGRVQGVSTISQQVARNLYLGPTRSAKRKILEAILAVRLERRLGKRRIFELYANVVEWGEGLWGIHAAAAKYFGVSATHLNPFQSAVLASLLPAPRRPLEGANLVRAIHSQRRLLHYMYAAGVMSLAEWRATAWRIALLERALRNGAAADRILSQIGRVPYGEETGSGECPATSQLFASQCNYRARVAYTTVLRLAVQRGQWPTDLPQRWSL